MARPCLGGYVSPGLGGYVSRNLPGGKIGQCMAEILKPDLCILGAGAAGLSVAAGAAQLGARTVLIEDGLMGGDCLNFGCVPSKCLIAAASAAHAFRASTPFGIAASEPVVDMKAVRTHIRSVIARIEPHDSVERFEGLGVRVIRARGRFRYSDEIEAGDCRIRARRFVVATGSRASVPPVPGLADIPYLTNETIFDLETLPNHLLILGAGPIGCELAQAFRRLGAAVTVVDIGPMLAKDDAELTSVVRARLETEGVSLRDRSGIERIEAGPAILLSGGERIEGSHLLVATGRRPNIEGIGLDAAGIEHGRRGITVDARLRTTNRRVFAIGDVTGGLQFTHVAGYHAGIVIKNALFRLPSKASDRATPWVTYTDPEIAHVGLTEEAAIASDRDHEIVRWPFAEVDRALAERADEGLIKLVVTPSGRVLGASIVGRHAGELILPWVLAVTRRMKLSAMTAIMAPYPTLGEISKRAAGAFYTPKLFSERSRKLVRWLAMLG